MIELASGLPQPLRVLPDERKSCGSTLYSLISKIVSFFFFETYVLTLGLGLVLYLADIVSDLVNGFVYIRQGNTWWGAQSMGLVLLPGFVRGFYELLRRPIFYENNSRSLQIKVRAGYQIFTSLSFGLDVLPDMVLQLPDSTALALVSAPFYTLIMAVWFPLLPIIQYLKLFLLQLSASRSQQVSDSTFDKLVDESRRAIAIKAVETFLEAAPQLFLQVYITYNRKHSDIVFPSYIAMFFSFLSLLKTSYDLQEVDRVDSAVSSPRDIITYFATSVTCFASTIFFRCLSLSMLSLYLSQYAHLEGIVVVPIILLVTGNCLLRFYVKKRGALLSGVMSAIAPARFICTSKVYGTENLTRDYLTAYTVFNTVAHATGLGVVCGINRNVEFQEDVLASRKWIQLVVLPVTGAAGLISVASTVVHWRRSLKSLFRAEFKHPDYQHEADRVSSFHRRSRYGEQFVASDLARNGFFCLNPAKSWPIVCYDCGLVVQELGGFRSIGILHAASLLRYKISYLASPTLTESKNPDLILQAYCRTLRVKPVCGVLDGLRVDFRRLPVRLESHLRDDGEDPSEEAQELASAGFVRTSRMTMACFQCFHTMDWSDCQLRLHSPWALHAWSKPGFECKYLLHRLRDPHVRLKTYPAMWFSADDRDAPTPEELSLAGFYCPLWDKRGRAWVKCFACKAFAFHWLAALTSRLEDLAAMVKDVGPAEFPGKAYGYLQMNGQREKPLISHYSQNMNCGFVQETLSSSVARMDTFPPNWREDNGLTVGRKEVSEAGFVYYPFNPKLAPHVLAGSACSKTICPRCLLEVDWAAEKRAPAEISHCEAARLLLKELSQRSSLAEDSKAQVSEHLLRTLKETEV